MPSKITDGKPRPVSVFRRDAAACPLTVCSEQIETSSHLVEAVPKTAKPPRVAPLGRHQIVTLVMAPGRPVCFVTKIWMT
jgi:hypothetical protein